MEKREKYVDLKIQISKCWRSATFVIPIIVGALGPDGEMLGFSNRAGGYAQHYVVATGASAFADYWGTSFATPRVSALAAQLRQRWPALRAEEITDIIKRSATDVGAPGVDAK